MNDKPADHYDEKVEAPVELSEQDLADLAALHGEPSGGEDREAPTWHTVLQVWDTVLRDAKPEKDVRPTPQYCNRIITSYSGVTYADMYAFRDLFYERVNELHQILVDEIATDDECLKWDNAAEDLEHNFGHYFNLLKNWQCRFLEWEVAWDCLNPNAAIDIATISQVHSIFFGNTGLTQHLENLQMVLTEEQSQEIADALNAIKEGQ
jgi:hypothetical protein